MEVKFKKYHDRAVLPSYAHPGDAGLDLTAIDSGTGVYHPHTDELMYVEYNIGIGVEIPEGFVGLVFPRSSITKTLSFLANSVGVIDSGYRGAIRLRFYNLPTEPPEFYESGDKIGQLVIMPIPKITPILVDDLSVTTRNTGGFGSTGK